MQRSCCWVSQGTGQDRLPVPPRGCHPSLGMPSALPNGAGCEEWGAFPGPLRECWIFWPLSKMGSLQGSCRWGTCEGRTGKPPLCRLPSLLLFLWVNFRRCGLAREEARVTHRHHVQASPGVCLVPCSRAWHWPSCTAGAGAVGSSLPALSPVTEDSPSGSLPSAGSCLGWHGLYLCAGAMSLPIPLRGEAEHSPACILDAKKKPFQSFYLHFGAGF